MSANEPTNPKTAYLTLTSTILLWGSAFSGLKFVLGQIDPYTLSALRLLVAAGGLALAAVVFDVPMPEREDWPQIGVTGLVAFACYHLALNFGMSFPAVSAGQASFIISTTPIWTAILAWRFLDERTTWRTWLGLTLGLGGIGYMSLDLQQLTISPGLLVVLLAALFNAVNLVLQKDLLDRYRGLHVAIYLTIVGSLPMLLYLPWAWGPAGGLDATTWLVVLYLGLGPIALGYFLNTITLSILDASRMSQAILLVPPVATLIAWLALGEAPSTQLFVGGPLILIGVLLGQMDRR